MAQSVLGTIPLTNSWVDVVSTYGAAASIDLLLYNRGNSNMEVYPSASGSAPADGATGVLVKPNDSTYANAAHVWVRAWKTSQLLVTTI